MAIALTVCFFGGILCATLASAKQRSVMGWFAIGTLIPIFGLALIVVLPSTRFDVSAGLGRVPGRPSEDLTATTLAPRTHLQNATLEGIARLVQLRDRGVLSPYEFAEKRAELLARI